MLYWLNLIFNSNQSLVLCRQHRSLGLLDIKTYRNKAIRIQLLNPSLPFIKNKFTIPKDIEEILEQLIFLNPHIKLDFNSNNPYFYSIPTKNITEKFTIIRDLCQFVQSDLCLISYTRSEEKLGHSFQWLKMQN